MLFVVSIAFQVPRYPVGDRLMDWETIITAPIDGTEILTYRNGLQAVAEWWPEENSWVATDGMMLVGVTHWMPLPPPPEGADDE